MIPVSEFVSPQRPTFFVYDGAMIPGPRCIAALILVSVLPVHAEETDPYAFFEAKVRPVLVERCYPCHSTATEKPKGGLRLDDKASLLRGGANGAVMVPGNAEASRLIAAVRYADGDLKMPPKEKLPDAEIEALMLGDEVPGR